MEVKLLQQSLSVQAPAVITALLNEWSAITDYRTLRDSLPGRLAAILQCRCVILYLRMGDTLQFASGSFDDTPGWSLSLLNVAHINPIALESDLPEAIAWREHRAVLSASSAPSSAEPPVSSLIAAPLLYRQRAIGVMITYRSDANVSREAAPQQAYWVEDDLPALEAIAGIVALLLENTRLLERDRERIHELSLLNNIANQLSFSLYEVEHVQSIVVQRAREISNADLCELLQPATPPAITSWLSPTLQTLLFAYFNKSRSQSATPLLIERPGVASTSEYVSQLPTNVKTFFAIPLYRNEPTSRSHAYDIANEAEPANIIGILVGGYYQARKLRKEDIVLLRVLANQAATALENMRLVHDVVEARNEARKLLRQVLEDQRIKAVIEEEKRRLDRLASLGIMSASVAHEVRNPLASIKTSMQILRDDLMEPENDIEETLESVSIVLQEVERLDAIVRDLLLFARPRLVHAVPCSLTELSDNVLHLMQGQFEAGHVTILRSYHDHPPVQVDEAQMKQVFFNLFTNALQAMPEGGLLTLHCEIMPADGLSEKSTGQQWAEMTVSDTGVGIAPEQLEQLFQPFYTTKTHGIGLGLPITRRLVEDHRGQLLVESQPGKGATFILRLPICEQNAVAAFHSTEHLESEMEDTL